MKLNAHENSSQKMKTETCSKKVKNKNAANKNKEKRLSNVLKTLSFGKQAKYNAGNRARWKKETVACMNNTASFEERIKRKNRRSPVQ